MFIAADLEKPNGASGLGPERVRAVEVTKGDADAAVPLSATEAAFTRKQLLSGAFS
jgi:hypothetical protein